MQQNDRINKTNSLNNIKKNTAQNIRRTHLDHADITYEKKAEKLNT